jgi:dihydrofolate reductase
MRRLIAFTQVSLDGYFAGPDGDLGWAHSDRGDPEWNEFVIGNARSGGELLFGRVTYELMERYWPTPLALENDPIMAERMNGRPKVVFSRTLGEPSWSHTRLVRGGLAAEVRKLKAAPGEGMAILGSGSLVSQLTDERLIDEYQIVVIPIALGKGRTVFEGVQEKLSLKRTKARTFGNGNVLLCYEPQG